MQLLEMELYAANSHKQSDRDIEMYQGCYTKCKHSGNDACPVNNGLELLHKTFSKETLSYSIWFVLSAG